MNTMLGTVPSEEDYKLETVDAGEMTEALLVSSRRGDRKIQKMGKSITEAF